MLIWSNSGKVPEPQPHPNGRVADPMKSRGWAQYAIVLHAWLRAFDTATKMLPRSEIPIRLNNLVRPMLPGEIVWSAGLPDFSSGSIASSGKLI